jgi:signal transduction histidine kinase
MERAHWPLASSAVVVGWLSALVVAAGAVVVADGPGGSTTYAGRTSAVAALTVATGIALVTAGIATWFGLQRRSIGSLAILAGLTWFAPVWVAYRGESLLVPSVAMLLVGLTFPFVVHLVLAYPTGKVVPVRARVFVILVYLEAIAGAVALALVRDPYFDPDCYSNCAVNSFLVRSLPDVARTIQSSDRWFVAITAAIFSAICVWRVTVGSQAARRSFVLVGAPAILFAATVLARIVVLASVRIEDPFDDTLLTIFVAEAAALVLVSIGMFAAFVRTRSERRAVARIVADLGEAPEPGSVQEALASAWGDPALRIAYPSSSGSRYIDASGRSIEEPRAGDGRTNIRLVRDDRTVAIVSHTGMMRDLDHEMGSALLLALENERLQAELLAELDELRASRARIVETSDDERRRLERDLHDGAQQRLLALSYDVRVAQTAAEKAQDEPSGTMLVHAIDQTQSALEALRQVAHGLYPAILAEAGLAAALETFADTSPTPIDLTVARDGRCPETVEAAAYFAVIEAVADAVDRQARLVRVSADRRDGRLEMTIDDDGSARISPMVAIEDRVGSAAGDVLVEPTSIRVTIPCE